MRQDYVFASHITCQYTKNVPHTSQFTSRPVMQPCQTRVRVNFQQKVHDSYGRVAKVEQIDDPEFYQQFFIKVDKGLFIQQEKL